MVFFVMMLHCGRRDACLGNWCYDVLFSCLSCYAATNTTGACGKTSLLCCFALGEFPKEYVSILFSFPYLFCRFTHFRSYWNSFCLLCHLDCNLDRCLAGIFCTVLSPWLVFASNSLPDYLIGYIPLVTSGAAATKYVRFYVQTLYSVQCSPPDRTLTGCFSDAMSPFDPPFHLFTAVVP